MSFDDINPVLNPYQNRTSPHSLSTTGEGSITTIYSNPIYTTDHDNQKVFASPSHMVPVMMKRIIPDVKLILMLRNPVDRYL